jgi:PhoH-like ATPase
MKTFNLLPQDMKTCDILPRNLEQQFALDILKDSSINLVTLEGLAGSGKTLLALASGLYGVLETQQYAKILLLKPIVPMDGGHEIGFLPGSMEEKLAPWMASYGDNIEQIMSKYIKEDDAPKKKKSKKEEDTYQEKQQGKINPIQELIAHGLLEFGSLEHIRGRSLPNQFIIIDEAQGLTKHAIRTIITRIGEGSKIVIMGDASQIDSPYLDSKSNGLSICVEAFKPVGIAAHIKFSKSERSQLAEIASQVL